MIERDEILAMSEQLAINTSDVQRDYVFSWLVNGVYQTPQLADTLVLKGGNALRKGYFPMTRFSDDLDFTAAQSLHGDTLVEEFNIVCRFAEEHSGVHFYTNRNKLANHHAIDERRNVYKLRLYFRNFAGGADWITLKVRVDVTEHDRLYLPVQTRKLIHPYSDSGQCAAEIRCVKLEEALADKLKCLLQRRYSHDLFDLVRGVFVNNDLAIDRREVVSTFLRKTIFEPSPVTARDLLLGVPFELMRHFWDKLVCPKDIRLPFDNAVRMVREGLVALFAPFAIGRRASLAYFPAELRNRIMDAGAAKTLIRLAYDGIEREVEPYSLAFKVRKSDGVAQEYFYGWDRTGGRNTGPGIKAFLQGGVEALDVTDIGFEPRFEIELSKAGDRTPEGYFARPFAAQSRGGSSRASSRRRSAARYTVQCTYCGREFVRVRRSTRLKAHKDGYGNQCFGRSGVYV